MKFINKKLLLFKFLLFAFVNSQLFDYLQKKDKKSKSESKRSGNSLFSSVRFKNDENGIKPKSIFDTKEINANESPKGSSSKPYPSIHFVYNSKIDQKEKNLSDAEHDKENKIMKEKEKITTIHPSTIEKDSEMEKLNKEIENKKNKLTELEKKSNESNQIQKKELQDMEEKFKHINNKTKKLQKLLNENKSLKELKDTFLYLKKDEHAWDTYINKLKQINTEILELTNDIEKLEHDLKVHYNSKMIEKFFSKQPIENADIQNNLTSDDDLTVENFITKELKIGNALKVNENLIEFPNNYQINYKGKQNKISDLIYYNKLATKLRTICGDNLNCFITIKEEKERHEKDDIIQKTISTIKNHLENINN